MKNLVFILFEILMIFCKKENKNSIHLTDGYYEINSYLNNLYLSVKNKNFIFSNKKVSFHIIPIANFSYFIQFKNKNIGINDNNLIIYNKNEINEIRKFKWNIYNIRRNQYIIQNQYNNKLYFFEYLLNIFKNRQFCFKM